MVFVRRLGNSTGRRAWSKRAGLGSALLASLFGADAAKADFYFHHWENQTANVGEFRLYPEAWMYSTTQNFDELGGATTPSGFTSYSRVQVDTNVRFGFSRAWTLYGRLAWSRVEVDSENLAGSAFGLPDQTVGLNLRVWENASGMTMNLQAQVDLPLYSNLTSEQESTPFLGDGSMDFTGGAFLALPLDGKEKQTWWITGGAGFTFRTAGFSQSIPWSVSIRHEPATEGLRLEAGIYGLQSLNSDNTTSYQDTGSGGSFVINAINPSIVSARARLGYRFNERLSAIGGFSTPLFGTNAPLGTVASLGIEFNWGPRGARGDKRSMTPEEYGQSNKGFVNYSFEAHVMRMNDRLNMFKIDKGRLAGVEVGQTLDVFEVKKDGSVGEAIARAKVMSVKSDESVLKVSEYYKEIWIEEGFVVKRPLD